MKHQSTFLQHHINLFYFKKEWAVTEKTKGSNTILFPPSLKLN